MVMFHVAFENKLTATGNPKVAKQQTAEEKG